jgi:hypothetical protein
MMGVWDSLCCTLRRCTAGFIVKASADAINRMKESAALRHRGIASRLSLSPKPESESQNQFYFSVKSSQVECITHITLGSVITNISHIFWY